MDRQQEFVLRTLEERDIRFVRLWFTDVLGTLKSVSVAPAELEAAFDEGIGFDGSAIEGFARVYESDMVAMPDPTTFQVFPFEGAGSGEAARRPWGEHRWGVQRSAGRQTHLVPYAGANLIRFNGIRNCPISAHDSGHPDKNSGESTQALAQTPMLSRHGH